MFVCIVNHENYICMVKPSIAKVFTQFDNDLDYIIWFFFFCNISNYMIITNPEHEWWLGQQGWLVQYVFHVFFNFHGWSHVQISLDVVTIYVYILPVTTHSFCHLVVNFKLCLFISCHFHHQKELLCHFKSDQFNTLSWIRTKLG
jgi:hypothetical protein